MYNFEADINKMNRIFKRGCEDKPTLPVDFRRRLQLFRDVSLQPEFKEVNEIIEDDWPDDVPVGDMKLETLTKIADWMGDIIVYCTSEMRKYGLPVNEVLQIIMESNFSKLGPDGEPILDPTGQKFLKGPNYWKPEPKILALLKAKLEGPPAP